MDILLVLKYGAHEFMSDGDLGPAYEKYQACTKCGEQRIKE